MGQSKIDAGEHLRTAVGDAEAGRLAELCLSYFGQKSSELGKLAAANGYIQVVSSTRRGRHGRGFIDGSALEAIFAMNDIHARICFSSLTLIRY